MFCSKSPLGRSCACCSADLYPPNLGSPLSSTANAWYASRALLAPGYLAFAHRYHRGQTLSARHDGGTVGLIFRSMWGLIRSTLDWPPCPADGTLADEAESDKQTVTLLARVSDGKQFARSRIEFRRAKIWPRDAGVRPFDCRTPR